MHIVMKTLNFAGHIHWKHIFEGYKRRSGTRHREVITNHSKYEKSI